MITGDDSAPALTVGRDETGEFFADVADIHDPAAVMAAEMLVAEVWRREHPDLADDNGTTGPFAVAALNGHQTGHKAPTLAEAEEAVTEARTDRLGWPLAIRDDRVPLGDGDPLPERPPPPRLLGLLYHDRTNYLAGDKSTGKTWIALEALAVAVHVYAMRVVWLDAEDSAEVFSERLARLGHRDMTTSPYVRRLNWSDWIEADPLDRAAVAAWLANGGNGGHMFIDSGSATESGDSADTFAAWKTRHLVHPATTIIEHVSKDPERRFGPAGSLRKGATASGSVLLIEGAPWTAHHDGSVDVRLDKDRPGGIPYRKGELCARIRGTPADGLLILEALPPGTPDEDIDSAILATVEASPGIISTGIREAVGGDGKQVSKRLLRLVKNGDIIRKPGKRRAQHHYIEDPDPTESDESDYPPIRLVE